jgi:hypothetical protein
MKKIALFEFNNKTKRISKRTTNNENVLSMESIPRLNEKFILKNEEGIASVYKVYDVHHNVNISDYDEMDTEIYIVFVATLEGYMSAMEPDNSI